MTTGENPICVALDTTDVAEASRLAVCLKDSVGWVKLGLEFFCRNGHDGVSAVRRAGAPPIFLDLKFHDIPNTVAGAVRAVAPLAPDMMTCHASGGVEMLRAAKDAAYEEADRLGCAPPKLLGVTVLTSMSDVDLTDSGVESSMTDQVRRLAALAYRADFDGVVCSPWEAMALRDDLGPDFLLVTPGVRPIKTAKNDQKRVMTPDDALASGASVLVIGRPITEAADPKEAATQILADIERVER